MPPLRNITFDKLGGVQTRKGLTGFLPYESPSCVGGLFYIDRAYTKRRGGEKYNTTALSSGLGLYHFRYNNDTSEDFIIAAGTNVYKGAGGSPSSILSGQTAAFYDFATYNDRAWLVNGVNKLYWYDGTNVRQAGIDAPSSNPTLGDGTSGSLVNGTYLVTVTYENAVGEESNPVSSFASHALTGSNDEITLSSIPVSSDAQVTKRNIYMSAVDGSILRLQQTINDNTTTTGSITTDATGRLLEFDHDVAPAGMGGVEVHKDRLIGFKGNTLYISMPVNDVVYFPQGTLDEEVDYRVQVGNSDPVIAIITFFDIILVFKKYDIYILSGSSELDFRIDRVRNDERVGSVSQRSISVIGNYCYFISTNGVYRTNGITVDEVSNPIGDFFDHNATSSTYKINKSLLPNSCAVYFKERNVFLIFCAAGAGATNNMCFAMDTNSISLDPETGKIYAKWSPWPGFTTQAATIVIESGVEKWFRMDDLGYVFRQEALNGDGSNITSFVTSSTDTTLVDSTQSWTDDLYIGLRVNILEGTGAGQERTITDNDGTTVTVNSAWDENPDTTSVYTIGGIPYHYQHAWDAYDNKTLSKRWRYSRPRFETSGNYPVTISYGFDFTVSDIDLFSYNLSSQSLWDQSLWDVGLFDGQIILQEKQSLKAGRIHRWSTFKIENNAAGQAARYYGVDKLYQQKGVR